MNSRTLAALCTSLYFMLIAQCNGDTSPFFLPWLLPRYRCQKNCGNDIQERRYCCYTIRVDKCCYEGSFFPPGSIENYDIPESSNGQFLGSFKPNIGDESDFLGSFKLPNSQSKPWRLISPSSNRAQISSLPNNVNPLIYSFQPTQSPSSSAGYQPHPEFQNLPLISDKKSTFQKYQTTPSFYTTGSPMILTPFGLFGEPYGSSRILIPPGSSSSDFNGNTKILTPPGSSVQSAGNTKILTPPGSSVQSAGNTKILIPPGYVIKSDGNTKILVPPGSSLNPRKNTKILIPPGYDFQSNDYYKILIPPGYDIQTDGETKLLFPPVTTGSFSGTFSLHPPNANYVTPPGTNPLSQNDTKSGGSPQLGSRILIPEGWNITAPNGTKILRPGTTSFSGSLQSMTKESSTEKLLKRERRSLHNFFLPGGWNEQYSYGGGGFFGGHSVGGSGLFDGSSQTGSFGGSFGGRDEGSFGGTGTFNGAQSSSSGSFGGTGIFNGAQSSSSGSFGGMGSFNDASSGFAGGSGLYKPNNSGGPIVFPVRKNTNRS